MCRVLFLFSFVSPCERITDSTFAYVYFLLKERKRLNTICSEWLAQHSPETTNKNSNSYLVSKEKAREPNNSNKNVENDLVYAFCVVTILRVWNRFE